MDLTALLPPESRVIDVGATSPDVGATLVSSGGHRYLGLVRPDRLAMVRTQAGSLGHRFHALESSDAIFHNSADVLLLRAPFGPALWSLRDLAHLKFVAVETGRGRHGLATRLAGLTARMVGRLTRRLVWHGSVECQGLRLDLVELTGTVPRRARRYLSPVWGVRELARHMEDAGLRHAVLRWFEDLPAIAAGEDLDLLVADDAVDKVGTLLDEEPGTIPVDLYSESGLPGTDYRGAAYYPPALARQLLERAVLHPSGCRVPDPIDHLHSLAYHAVYHKGDHSGLRSTTPDQPVIDPEHDYTDHLHRLAASVGVDVDLSLEGLDEYLAGVGWQPPHDALRRLAPDNAWIRRRYFGREPLSPEPPETTVFLIRERTLRILGLDDVLGVLDHFGFETLRVEELDAASRERCTALTRGGNWGRGPYPLSGGAPTVAVVALHYAPQSVSPVVLARYPGLSNAEIYFAKLRIRELVETLVPADQQFNPVHSSDNDDEAWEYVSVAFPTSVSTLRNEVGRRRAENRTTVPVVRQLSRGRRAKVEVVEGEDGRVVRKTYVEGHLRYLDREIQARTVLGQLDAVPEITARGTHWFECPLYQNRLNWIGDRPGKRLVPLSAAHGMVRVLREIHALGYDLIDAKPQNFVLDPVHGLKVVDFEFLHRYEGEPPEFAASYGLVGPPDSFSGDVPVGDLSYAWRWQRFTGMPLDVMLHGSPAIQLAHRAVFRLRRMTVTPGSPVRGRVREAVDRARSLRGRLSWTFRVWCLRRALRSIDAAMRQ